MGEAKEARYPLRRQGALTSTSWGKDSASSTPLLLSLRPSSFPLHSPSRPAPGLSVFSCVSLSPLGSFSGLSLHSSLPSPWQRVRPQRRGISQQPRAPANLPALEPACGPV